MNRSGYLWTAQSKNCPVGNRPALARALCVSVALPGGCGRAAAPPQPLPGPGRAGGARLVCGRGCERGFTPLPRSPNDEIKRADSGRRAALLSRQSTGYPLPPGPGPGPLLRQPRRRLPQCPAGRPPPAPLPGWDFLPGGLPALYGRQVRSSPCSLPPRPAPPLRRCACAGGGRALATGACGVATAMVGAGAAGGGGHGRERPGPR